MDFDQLNSFVEVARHNSFSRAAGKRFRTQPAISSQIRALEEEVGARLFDRSGGKVSLTASGKLFLKYAEEALEARRHTIAAVAEMQSIPRGEIVVGANEGTCLHVLPEVFAEFKKKYPNVSVSVARAERARIVEAVIDKAVDFGIVSLPVADARLKMVPVHQDELVVIAPPRHPIAASGLKAAPLAEVAKYPLLLPKAGRTREVIEAMFRELGVAPKISMELESSEVLKRFVAADVGIGFIGSLNVRNDVRTKTLVCLPIEGRIVRRDLGLIYRKDKALSRAAQAFIEIAVRTKAAAAGGVASG